MAASERISRARTLRKNATPEENLLWYRFLRRHPARFRRQHPIGPYILDFFCPGCRIAVELDGGGHYEPEQAEHDRRRDQWLSEQSIFVLRFTNTEIKEQFAAVCETIQRKVAEHPPQSAVRTAPPQGGS